MERVGSGHRLRVEMLHQFRLVVDDRDAILSEGGQRLIVRLALDDRPRARANLAGLLWPERSESDAAASLRRALWRLNRDVPGLVEARGQQVGLCDGTEVDVREIYRLADAIDEAPPLGNRIVRLLEGDLLPYWSFDGLDSYRESLRQTRLHTLEALARRDLLAGRLAGALLAGLAAVGIDPLRESAQRIVIAAHLAEGNVAEAVRQYLRFRDVLWDELQLSPSAALQSMLPSVGERQRPDAHIRLAQV